MIIQRRITIVQIRKPVKHELNDELQWFGNSLGLFSQRDKDRSCFRIFIELLKTTKQNYPVSSDELAYKTGLSRGTVIHHINKMMEAGLVIVDRNRYILRVGNLAAVVEEVQKDLDRMCDDLRKMAAEIDREMGM
jgi:predicted transcriptional regulator